MTHFVPDKAKLPSFDRNDEFIPDKNKFRNVNNLFLLRPIFLEFVKNAEEYEKVVYTLKSHDHKGFPSLKRLYLETEDLSEYEFAEKYLFNFDHWKALCDSEWFKPLVEEWRADLRSKLESRYLGQLRELAEEDSKEGFQAKKILLERIKKPKTTKAVGRPEKDKTPKSPLPDNQVALDYKRLLGDA